MAGATSIIKSSTFDGVDVGGGSYADATTGWLINGSGRAYFFDATIAGSIDIGGFDSGSFHVDSQGNMWLGSGVFATGTFKVTKEGDAYANSLTTNQLELGGNTEIASNGKIYLGAGNYKNSDTPFYADSNSQFSLGEKLFWDGSLLTVVGSLKLVDGTLAINASTAEEIADSAASNAVDAFGNEIRKVDGFIGGLTISPTQLYYGAGNFANPNTAFYVAKNAGTGQANFSLGDKLNWDGSTLNITGNVVITGGSTLDAINNANNTANTANNTANTANNTANTAIDEANDALIVANGAATTANNALPASTFNKAEIIKSINNSTNSTTINGGVIETGTVVAGSVVADFIAGMSIKADQITAGTITASIQINSPTINSATINSATINNNNGTFRVESGGQVYVNAIFSSLGALRLDGAGSPVNLFNADGIPNGKVVSDSYTEGRYRKLSNNINGSDIADGAITTSKIGNLQVDTLQIASGAITNSKIDSSAVSNDKIQNGAVNASKASTGTGSSQLAVGNHTHDVAGNSGTAQGHTHNSGTYLAAVSTLKLKKEISKYDFDASKLLDLELVRFKYKNQAKQFQNNNEWGYGYIAEDVHALGIKEIIGYDAGGRIRSINYGILSTLLLELVKEHNKEIKNLKKVIKKLEKEN